MAVDKHLDGFVSIEDLRAILSNFTLPMSSQLFTQLMTRWVCLHSFALILFCVCVFVVVAVVVFCCPIVLAVFRAVVTNIKSYVPAGHSHRSACIAALRPEVHEGRC